MLAGKIGPALDRYLLEPPTDLVNHRIDVVSRTGLERVWSRLSAADLPSGRWPEHPDRPLSASQQFAVTTALQELGASSGVFGVNGPPGTGKTTMLRDLVADVVVTPAEALSRLRQPGAPSLRPSTAGTPTGTHVTSTRSDPS